MRIKRQYIFITVVIILPIIYLWIKSHETRVLPEIPDLDVEEKEISLSPRHNPKRITLITFQGYQISFGNLDLAHRLKQELSQLTSVRDSAYKDLLLQHIDLLEHLPKDTLLHEHGPFQENWRTDFYSLLVPWQVYKLLLEGKAEVMDKTNQDRVQKIKAIVRKWGNTDVSITFLTQQQDTIYTPHMVAFE